jgi:hypothetical protein
MSEELITAKLNELDSIADMEAGKPGIPVTTAVAEAESLFNWCNKDKDLLIRGGLDWKLVDDLPIRLDALRVSQANWKDEYKTFQDCQEEWKVASPAAYNLRDELVHFFYHAFYNKPGEYAKVRRIDEGSTNADMIQDLIELSVMGKNHTQELQSIGLDLTLLDTARAKSFELGELLGKVNGAITETSPKLIIRNKAYNHLKEAMDEIRRIGQFVFWRDNARLSGYVSQYSRKANEGRKKKEEPTAV